MYDIPLFDLNYGIEEEQAVIETIRSKWISSGPKCAELEKVFADMLGVIENSDAGRRDRIRDFLHLRGMQTSVHYPAVHRFSAYFKYV